MCIYITYIYISHHLISNRCYLYPVDGWLNPPETEIEIGGVASFIPYENLRRWINDDKCVVDLNPFLFWCLHHVKSQLLVASPPFPQPGPGEAGSWNRHTTSSGHQASWPEKWFTIDYGLLVFVNVYYAYIALFRKWMEISSKKKTLMDDIHGYS